MNIKSEPPNRIKDILREADTAILKLVGESHHLLYQLLRITAAKFAQVDSFYIGFYCEDNMIVFPYSFDDKEYYDPNEISAAASCGVSERSRRQAAAGRWPIRGPLGSDKQGYGASSGVLTSRTE